MILIVPYLVGIVISAVWTKNELRDTMSNEEVERISTNLYVLWVAYLWPLFVLHAIMLAILNKIMNIK